jgi:hypothetical protein
MKQLLSYTFGSVLLLCLFPGCKEKRVESTTYGDFRYEVTNWERKRILWEGKDHLSSEHRMYYKDEEVDFEKLATDYLKEKTNFMEALSLTAAAPTFFHRDSALYCELDAGLHSTIGVLTVNKEGLIFIPLINKSIENFEPYFSFYQMDSIGNQKILMTNYLLHEQPFRVLAKFEPIIRGYDNYTGDTTASAEVDTYYAMSPDNKTIVRSFVKDMFGYPELASLFLTEISSGKTTEIPLMNGDSLLVKTYVDNADSTSCNYWFRENFEWVAENDSYTLRIRNPLIKAPGEK